MAKQESSTAVLEQPAPLTPEQQHQLDKQQRAARRNTKERRQLTKDCCDPEKAAFFASQVPRFRFEVSFDHAKHGLFRSQEIAANESEAWAKFCDRHPKVNHPGPRDPGRTITCLGPVGGA